MIKFKDFKKLDMRVGEIIKAEKIPQTKKLLKLKVSLGKEKRTLVAGIGEHYKPDEIIGLKVIVVTNMEPAIIKGVRSDGMLLGVGCSEENYIALVTLNRDAPMVHRLNSQKKPGFSRILHALNPLQERLQ